MKRIPSIRHLADKAADRLTVDTFQNFAAKLGIGTQNLSSGNSYGFNPVSRNRTLVEWMYRGSWICGVGVDCVADDMTREWVELKSGAPPKALERVYAMMRTMQIPQSFNAMSKWARLYGGALNVIMIDGQRLDTPLRLETVAPGQFKGLITLDRWMVTPDLNSAVRTPGPDYGNPEWYTIDAQTPNLPLPRQRVHYSRTIRQEGVELPFWQKQAENMWGISVMERLYDRLTAFDSSTQGAAQQMFRSYLRTMKIKNLRDIIAEGGKAYDALIQNMNLVRLYQSNEGLTLVDAEDEFDSVANTFAGQAEIINCMADQISGALQIPITRLFGQSPGGMGTTDENGMRTYEDNIKRQQERWYRRPCDIIIPLCAINAKVELQEGWEYDFVNLRQMTEEQQSKINADDTAAVVAAQGTGLLPGAVFLKELRASGRKTGRWTNITDEDIGDAHVADIVPSPSELGIGPGAGGGPDAPKGGGEEEETESANPDKVTADRRVLVDLHGLQLFIENHMGTVRKGNGWQTVMPADYGFIEGVGSAEGGFEEMDCFVGPSRKHKTVYIIDQTNLDGEFDEHKCMLGFVSADQARDCYLRAFSDGKGEQRLHSMTAVDMAAFKQWLKTGNHTMPAAGQF